MAKSVAATTELRDNFLGKVKVWPQRSKTFYTEVRTEMKKVTTPTLKEVQATTIVVIITVFIFGAYFFVVDNILQHSLDKLFRYFAHR